MKILAVDDNKENIYMLETLFKSYGYEVESSQNGVEALEKLAEQDFDVVISDILMPEMDGYEAMRAIRRRKRFTELPIIALTAYAMTGDKEVFLKAGMDGYLAKPVELQELEKALHQMCSGGETCFPPRDEKR